MMRDYETFRLNITCNHDAFSYEPAAEVARILREVARRLEAGEDFRYFQTLWDINGNDVGRAAFKPADYQ